VATLIFLNQIAIWVGRRPIRSWHVKFGSAVEPAFDQILIFFFLLKLSAVCIF